MMKKFLWTLLFAAFLMPFSAKAQCDPGVTSCSVTIQMQDSYGDGWNGNEILVYQGTTLRGTVTLSSGTSGVATVAICANDSITFVWSEGSYSDEASFSILNGDGTTIVANAWGDDYDDEDVIATAMPVCPSCIAVTNLTVSGLTSTSFTLNWTDANNSGASYTIYDMDDTSVVATGLTTTSYAFTSMTAATVYTYAVVATCSATEESAPVVITVVTPCEAFVAPFNETFDTNSTTLVCWNVSGDATWYIGVGDYSTSTGTHSGSTNAYITHSSTGNATKLISPVIDLSYTTTPQLNFWHVQRSWAGDIDELNVYYRADLDSAWTLLVAYTNAYATWTEETIILPNPTATYQVAFEMVDSWGYGVGIDDVYLGEAPSCMSVSNLAVDAVTSESVVLVWSDTINTGATYTIYDMSDSSVVATNISATTYTVTNLTPNTVYTFGVVANCSATDESFVATVNARTGCAPLSLPFTEDFSTSLSSDPCWSGASNATAAQVFAGAALNYSTISWSYTSSVRDGLDAGHYYKNVYGSSVKSWMITPAIDLSNVTTAQLSFDVALTDYYNAALPDVDGDTNTSQVFYVIVSTDGGNTWLETNTTKWQNVGGDYTYASLASLTYQNKVISLDQYVGDTIKIAFYCQSLWSGGDNDLHIDNIAVTEGGVTPPPANDSVTLVIAVNDPVKGTTTPAPGIYMHATTDSAVTITALPYTGYTFTGWHINVISSGSMFDTVFNAPDSLNYMMVGFNGGVPGSVVTVTALFGNGSIVDSGYYLTVNYDSTMGDVFYIEGPYQAGDSAFVYAFPNAGYRFVSFTEGGTVVSTDFYYEFVMTGNRTLTANFEIDSMSSADSLTIITAVNNAAMGTVNPAPGIHRYAAGDVYTITATPNSGYFFGGWIVSMDLGFMVYSDTLVGWPNVYSDTVDEFYLGYTMTFTAMFTTDSVPIVNMDSVVITLAVNNATMGTITPAPGTYTYAETDSIHIAATAFDGYQFVGWEVHASQFGYTMDTIILTDENTFDESLDGMGGAILSLTAMFVPAGSQTYTVTVTANNSTLGTVSGGGAYAAGSTVTLTATPATGCSFQAWVINGDTITTNPYSFTITGNVTAMAIFVAGSNGIDDANMANVNVYSADSRIIVKGAEGQDINVYDLNGRTVSSQMNAAGTTEFHMAHTGVYLVKVGNAAAQRVLVVR